MYEVTDKKVEVKMFSEGSEVIIIMCPTFAYFPGVNW
jgi:hypothetical protein